MGSQGRVLVTGGAGYVGAVLVPHLLAQGYPVRVLDWYLYGDHVLAAVADHPDLDQVRGDIRDQELLRRVLPGCEAVIHLACISNDPSFELNPALSRSVNYDAFAPLVRIAKEAGVRRFIYASTSSVYGVSDAPEVTEDHPLVPLTDYNRYKGLCEPVLLAEQGEDFATVVVRPATVCGYSPRQRLDLTVNILATHAVERGVITVFGGRQQRPNIHIADVVDLYTLLLDLPAERIAGRTYNAGYQNRSVAEIAELVRGVVARELPDRPPVEVVTQPSDDLRSYHISSEKIRRELEFVPQRALEDAVRELIAALGDGRLPDPLADPRYYNIQTMQRAEIR